MRSSAIGNGSTGGVWWILGGQPWSEGRLCVLAKTVGEVRQRVVFRGTTSVNSSLDRKTKEPKLTMRWQDSSNLVVTTFPNVIADQRLTSEGLPSVLVRQANAPNAAKTAVLLEGGR
jgi:hypothetical protein